MKYIIHSLTAESNWSSGMIVVSGTTGREFDSRIGPTLNSFCYGVAMISGD
eukprot:CAMPEP_0203736442 /NCGR_PEP_ID=MMETSP0092-20131115/35833_1 /ASSEMBLY_ACC=CAM_ASM_001090 /TAXON_ID=426623 /ORGANISM="Chaetoceros affinis, Strain CCMP159" /LENGTH=50 /DNA_ID=CAMNT_0050621363 /DNA_START=1 /DNA_END=150 /DNA_ORIENTATION=+